MSWIRVDMHTFLHTYRSRCSMMRESFKWVIKNQKRALSMTSRRRKKRKSISNTCYETINHNQADFYECICNNIFHLTATSLNRNFITISRFSKHQRRHQPFKSFVKSFSILHYLFFWFTNWATQSSLGYFFILKLQFKANWQQRETTIKFNVHYAFLPKGFIVAYLSVWFELKS